MSLTSCLFVAGNLPRELLSRDLIHLGFAEYLRRYSTKGIVVRKISVINKELFHMINNIFWNLGFKNETQADKVIIFICIMCIISLIDIIHIILIILLFCRLVLISESPITSCRKSVLSRATIAATINGLGDKFKPELSAAWLAYMTYPNGQVAEADIMGGGTLEIDE
jgi:hypothetical protein